MVKNIGLALAIAVSTSIAASAQSMPPSPANLIEDFMCGTTLCETRCFGPGGVLTISARNIKVFQFTLHARRLWLLADGAVYVLGDDDRCLFGGSTPASMTFVTTPPSATTAPTALSPGATPIIPQSVCIGQNCPSR